MQLACSVRIFKKRQGICTNIQLEKRNEKVGVFRMSLCSVRVYESKQSRIGVTNIPTYFRKQVQQIFLGKMNWCIHEFRQDPIHFMKIADSRYMPAEIIFSIWGSNIENAWAFCNLFTAIRVRVIEQAKSHSRKIVQWALCYRAK